MKRVVSLIPSGTEMVCALGCENQLVGRSHECDFPPSVLRLPVCTASAIPETGTSREIDEAVKRHLEQAKPLYGVATAVLKELRPDLILTQAQCHVCAVGESDVRRTLVHDLDSTAQLVALHGEDLPGVWRDMHEVAKALGVPERGVEVVGRLQDRVRSIGEQAGRAPTTPTIVSLEWMQPLMVAGHWMPELIRLAGGRPAIGETGSRGEVIGWETLLRADPDVLLISPCGFSIERTQEDVTSLTAYPGWEKLTAVQYRRVFLADGHHFFNRPGPRLVESLEILAEILHPDIFHFGHEGNGWRRLAS